MSDSDSSSYDVMEKRRLENKKAKRNPKAEASGSGSDAEEEKKKAKPKAKPKAKQSSKDVAPGSDSDAPPIPGIESGALRLLEEGAGRSSGKGGPGRNNKRRKDRGEVPGPVGDLGAGPAPAGDEWAKRMGWWGAPNEKPWIREDRAPYAGQPGEPIGALCEKVSEILIENLLTEA
jgi:hypothetical protein